MPSINKLDQTFLRIAKEISTFSNCVSFQVGCVFVKDYRIISMGYNGTPSGYINCNDKFPELAKKPRSEWTEKERTTHHNFSENHEIHAEQNALIHAAKNAIRIGEIDVYSSLQPCNTCLKILTPLLPKRIIYSEKYDKCSYKSEVLEMLTNLTVNCSCDKVAVFE